jgi:hypothetical protein
VMRSVQTCSGSLSSFEWVTRYVQGSPPPQRST